MSIKNIWRDSSFRKFLVGGVVLITLVGVGLNAFKPKAAPTDNQEISTSGVETNKPTETVQNTEENNASVETETDRSATNDGLTNISNSDVLPHSGPADFWLPLGILSAVTYGATYFLQKR